MTDQTRNGERDIPDNEMDRLADRLAEVLSRYGRSYCRADISLRMIAEFAWVFGLEPDFKLVPRHGEALAAQGGGEDGQV